MNREWTDMNSNTQHFIVLTSTMEQSRKHRAAKPNWTESSRSSIFSPPHCVYIFCVCVCVYRNYGCCRTWQHVCILYGYCCTLYSVRYVDFSRHFVEVTVQNVCRCEHKFCTYIVHNMHHHHMLYLTLAAAHFLSLSWSFVQLCFVLYQFHLTAVIALGIDVIIICDVEFSPPTWH